MNTYKEMNKYRLYSINENEFIEIKSTGQISWSDNEDTLGMEFSFSMAINKEDRLARYTELEVGDKILFKNETNDIYIFEGIIVSVTYNDQFEVQYKCLDYLHLLNKSKDYFQFNRVSASTAISQILRKYNVPIGNIENIPTSINEIYANESVSDVVKNILEEVTSKTGIEYCLESREGKVYIEKLGNLKIYPTFKPAPNIASINPVHYLNSLSKTISIEDMKNQILVISEEKETKTIEIIERDEESIAKFGLFSEVLSVNKEEEASARSLARQELKNTSKISEEYSITCLGDDKARSSRIFDIDKEELKNYISGTFKIISSSHTLDGSKRTMDLTIEKI